MSQRNPTVADVAGAAGVSTATVSRVINGVPRVAARTRYRVQEAIQKLGYRPNRLARSLVTGKSGVVGVLIPDVAGPLYAQIARGIEDVLERRDMTFMMVTSDRDARQEEALIELLLSQRVDGLILVGSRLEEQRLTQRIAPSIPVVLMQREAADPVRCYSILSLDNETGVRAGLEYLCASGHTRIAHVSGVRRDGALRRETYLAVMSEWGLPPLVVAGDGLESGGERAAQELAGYTEVTAVFCANDRTALGLYHALKQRGIRIPDDVSVLGFDDLPYAAYLDPPLSTVRQDGRQMGRLAAEELLVKLAGNLRPEAICVPAAFTLRESICPWPAPPAKGGSLLLTSAS